MCGHCKKQAAERMAEFLTDIAIKRDHAEEIMDEYLK
jgi:tryptophanyl-tRNA synthetase